MYSTGGKDSHRSYKYLIQPHHYHDAALLSMWGYWFKRKPLILRMSLTKRKQTQYPVLNVTLNPNPNPNLIGNKNSARPIVPSLCNSVVPRVQHMKATLTQKIGSQTRSIHYQSDHVQQIQLGLLHRCKLACSNHTYFLLLMSYMLAVVYTC